MLPTLLGLYSLINITLITALFRSMYAIALDRCLALFRLKVVECVINIQVSSEARKPHDCSTYIG